MTQPAPFTPRALVGFDAFIDVICTPVASRASMAPRDYTTFHDIPAFAHRVHASAGKSTNIELVVREERFGGNAPLLAGGLAALGVETTFIGCIRDDKGPGIHPVFQPFADRCKRVIPLAPPSRTECLEFPDGKVMFNKVFTQGREHESMQAIRWTDILTACKGVDALRAIVAPCSLIGITNWSIMAGVEDIWAGLARDILPHIPPAAPGCATPRRILIDISDPAKRTREDLRRALHAIASLHQSCPVTLGLNLSEAEQVHAALSGDDTPLHAPLPDKSTALTRSILASLQIDRVVVHPREGAAGADATGSTWVDGPFTPNPVLSTGAGDHFNAGLALALMQGLPLRDTLTLATATSGAYVRDARSPSLQRARGLCGAGVPPATGHI